MVYTGSYEVSEYSTHLNIVDVLILSCSMIVPPLAAALHLLVFGPAVKESLGFVIAR
jgi:hypothetical protein